MATLDQLAKDKDELRKALEFWRLRAGNNIISYVKSKNKDRIKAKPSATPESRTSSFGFSQLQYRPISQFEEIYQGLMRPISKLGALVSRGDPYAVKGRSHSATPGTVRFCQETDIACKAFVYASIRKTASAQWRSTVFAWSGIRDCYSLVMEGVEMDERELVIKDFSYVKLEQMLREDDLLLIENGAIVYGSTRNPRSLKLDRHLHGAIMFIQGLRLKTNGFWILLFPSSKSKVKGKSPLSEISSLDNKRSMVDIEATSHQKRRFRKSQETEEGRRIFASTQDQLVYQKLGDTINQKAMKRLSRKRKGLEIKFEDIYEVMMATQVWSKEQQKAWHRCNKDFAAEHLKVVKRVRKLEIENQILREMNKMQENQIGILLSSRSDSYLNTQYNLDPIDEKKSALSDSLISEISDNPLRTEANLNPDATATVGNRTTTTESPSNAPFTTESPTNNNKDNSHAGIDY